MFSKIKGFQLVLCWLFVFIVFSSGFSQDENDGNDAIYTKVNNSVVLVKSADPIKFDGVLDLNTEYKGIDPIQFPAGVNSFAKVYIKQCSGVIYFGFYVPDQFYLKNFVRIAAGPSYESITAAVFNPYNLTRKNSLDKNLYKAGNNFPVPNKGFLAKADTIHKKYWTCEIKANLSEFNIDTGLLGQQLYVSFAVSDANEKIYYSRDFQGWHSPATYFSMKSLDNWGETDEDSLVTTDEIKKFDDECLSLYYLFDQANKLLAKNEIENAVKKLQTIVKVNPEYYFVQFSIANVYNDNGMPEKALEAINKALKLNPYLLQAKVLKGAILEKLGRLEDALNYFQLLYAEYPEDTSFALQIGKIQVDISLQASAEAEKLTGEEKEAKLKRANDYLTKSRSWFDGLALKHIEDIKVLVSMAIIYTNAKLPEHAKSYISIVQKIVDENVYQSPSLLEYFCYLRDKKSAADLTEKCIKTAIKLRDAQYEMEVTLTADQKAEIESELEKIEKTDEKAAKRKELTAQALARLDAENKNFAYLRYSTFLFEHASVYKESNMFKLYEKYMKLLYDLIHNDKFPRRTMRGSVASEKILAEYMIACVCIEDYTESAKIYDELKTAWRLSHSVNNNYVQIYAELEKYPEYWAEELKQREKDAQNNLPRVQINTSKGKIVLELFEDDAPNAVKNFIHNIELGLYKNNNFSTIVKGLIIQAGKVKDHPGNIETQPSNRKFYAGTIAMVNEPDVKASENTEFFISLHAIPWLNGIRTVFGRVTQGMDVVYAIDTKDVIYSIEILNKRKDTKYVPEYAK